MIYYQDNLEGISPAKLKGFFQGWRNPQSPEHHLKILEQSSYFLLAFDDQEDRVVGFITVLTDDIQAVFIPLLEVLPAYQGQGIGSELMKRILNRYAHIPALDLMCDASVQPFYASLGLQKSVGMIRRNY